MIKFRCLRHEQNPLLLLLRRAASSLPSSVSFSCQCCLMMGTTSTTSAAATGAFFCGLTLPSKIWIQRKNFSACRPLLSSSSGKSHHSEQEAEVHRMTTTSKKIGGKGGRSGKRKGGFRFFLRRFLKFSIFSALFLVAFILTFDAFNDDVLTRSLRTMYIGIKMTLLYKLTYPSSIEELSSLHLRVANMILDTCLKNEGLYIKFGQALSTFNHVLPQEYTTTLRVLLDKAPPISFEEVHSTLCAELGISALSEVFLEFDPQPVAAASVAQVHQAKILVKKEKNNFMVVDGKHTNQRNKNNNADVNADENEIMTVAVKVQKPKISRQIWWDLLCHRILCYSLQYFFEIPLVWSAQTIEDHLVKEVDFVQEAENMERIRYNFLHDVSPVPPMSCFDDDDDDDGDDEHVCDKMGEGKRNDAARKEEEKRGRKDSGVENEFSSSKSSFPFSVFPSFFASFYSSTQEKINAFLPRKIPTNDKPKGGGGGSIVHVEEGATEKMQVHVIPQYIYRRTDFRIPILIPTLSTGKVLVTEWMEGAKFHEVGLNGMELKKINSSPSAKSEKRLTLVGIHETSDRDSSTGTEKGLESEGGEKTEEGAPLPMKQVIATTLECFGAMMFHDGFLHCDPHPANVLIRRKTMEELKKEKELELLLLHKQNTEGTSSQDTDSVGKMRTKLSTTKRPTTGTKGFEVSGSMYEVILLDFGLCISERKEFRAEYCALFEAMFCQDYETLEEIVKSWGIGHPELFASMTLMHPYQIPKANDDADGNLNNTTTSRTKDVVDTKKNISSQQGEEGGEGLKKKNPFLLPHGQQKVTKEEITRLQTQMKEHVSELLKDDELIPKELIFVGRATNLLRSLNKHFGSPVNRINIFAECARQALIILRQEEKLKKTGRESSIIFHRHDSFFKSLMRKWRYHVTKYTLALLHCVTQWYSWLLDILFSQVLVKLKVTKSKNQILFDKNQEDETSNEKRVRGEEIRDPLQQHKRNTKKEKEGVGEEGGYSAVGSLEDILERKEEEAFQKQFQLLQLTSSPSK